MKDFFKNKDGRIVLWQSPSIALSGWLILRLLSMALNQGNIKTGCQQLSTAFLFTWAFLELTKGANYFRKLLGFVVLGAILISYFRQPNQLTT